MKILIICNKNTYSEQERAKEILFKKANINDFELKFIFDNKKYYKKVKKEN